MFSGCENIININFIHFNTENITTMKGMFSYCKNLKNINLFAFNTKNVIDMSYMFYGCELLNNLDLLSFDFIMVKYIDNIFSYYKDLDLDNILIYYFDNKIINIIKSLKQDEMINTNNYLNEFEILPSDFAQNAEVFKLTILGEADSGKLKLLQALNIYKDNYDFYPFKLKYKNKIIRLDIWDYCRQAARYRSLVRIF